MLALTRIGTRLSLVHSGYIAGSGDGIVTVQGKPDSRKIWLLNAKTMAVEQVVTSPSNGHYIFMGLDLEKKYLVMVRDYKKESEPFCWDNVKPADDLTIAEQQSLWQSWQNNTSYPTQPSKTYPLPLTRRNNTNGHYSDNNFSSFLEGCSDSDIIDVTLQFSNTSIRESINGIYTINNINIDDLKSMTYNNKTENFDLLYYSNKTPGYITGSVNNSCDGTDFKIRVYREDGFFIGDYDIAENGSYEIPNLNVHSSYDVLLYDLNLAVETQVNSRRIPTAYSVTE